MAPRTRLDQTSCRHAVCVGSPLSSQPASPPALCSAAWQLDTLRPLTSLQPHLDATALEQGGAAHSGGRANRMLVGTEMPARPSQSRTSWVRVLHVTAHRATWPRAPTLAPCPFPCTPSLTPDKPCLPWTLGEHRKGGVLSLRSGSVWLWPRGTWVRPGGGESREHDRHPVPRPDAPATGFWCL